MKILYVTASIAAEWGGPSKIVLELSRALAARGHEIAVYTAGDQAVCKDISRVPGVVLRVFPLGVFSKIWQSYSPELREALVHDLKTFDLVHIHEIWHYPQFVAAKVAQKEHKPYLVTIHGSLEPWALRFKSWKKAVAAAFFQKQILRNASLLHALTEGEAEQIRRFGIQAPVRVIPSGIYAEDYAKLPPREIFRAAYPVLEGRTIILFLGRLHPKKGLDILARAFGKVARAFPDAMLVIAGPDSQGYLAEVEKILKDQGVLDRALFTGILTGSAKYEALASADIFVLPSYSEGFSQAVLEAMAVGLPVVISKQCYFPEVEQRNAGLVIDPREDALVEALSKMLSDANFRQEMAENGKALVKERFTWDAIADAMVRLYEEVLTTSGSIPRK